MRVQSLDHPTGAISFHVLTSYLHEVKLVKVLQFFWIYKHASRRIQWMKNAKCMCIAYNSGNSYQLEFR